jgi:hypothetical protein
MRGMPKNLRSNAYARWLASASAAVAIMAILWLALFSALTHRRAGMRIAQAPSLMAERATDGDRDHTSGVFKKLVR